MSGFVQGQRIGSYCGGTEGGDPLNTLAGGLSKNQVSPPNIQYKLYQDQLKLSPASPLTHVYGLEKCYSASISCQTTVPSLSPATAESSKLPCHCHSPKYSITGRLTVHTLSFGLEQSKCPVRRFLHRGEGDSGSPGKRWSSFTTGVEQFYTGERQ